MDAKILLLIPLIKDFVACRAAIIEIEYTPNTKTTSPIGDVIEQISKRNKNNAIKNVLSVSMAKTEHSHPLGMVVSTHFRCGKGVKRGLKNGALPFKID